MQMGVIYLNIVFLFLFGLRLQEITQSTVIIETIMNRFDGTLKTKEGNSY